jgi:hypothetical protein
LAAASWRALGLRHVVVLAALAVSPRITRRYMTTPQPQRTEALTWRFQNLIPVRASDVQQLHEGTGSRPVPVRATRHGRRHATPRSPPPATRGARPDATPQEGAHATQFGCSTTAIQRPRITQDDGEPISTRHAWSRCPNAPDGVFAIEKETEMIKSRILSSKPNGVFAGRQSKQSYGPTK